MCNRFYRAIESFFVCAFSREKVVMSMLNYRYALTHMFVERQCYAQGVHALQAGWQRWEQHSL